MALRNYKTLKRAIIDVTFSPYMRSNCATIDVIDNKVALMADTAQALRVILAKNNRSQNWLAKEVGKSRPYICKLCNNERVPSFGLIDDICKVFDVPVSEFMKGGE